MRRGGTTAIREASSFLFGDDTVYRNLAAVTRRLAEVGVRYAVAGDLALVAHGQACTTLNIAVLVTPEGLIAAHRALDGLGYVPPFTGSKNLRDAATGVRIEFLTTGGFPGDGKPKPVAFPDPADVAEAIDGVHYLRLPTLIELKLASGMTGGVNRLKDLADVIELSRALSLPRAFGEMLDASVRDKFYELWDGLAAAPADE